jgi:hypothetical protein
MVFITKETLMGAITIKTKQDNITRLLAPKGLKLTSINSQVPPRKEA